MTRFFLATMASLAFASSAAAQHAGHQPPATPVADAACTAEHAAMGHCKLAPSAPTGKVPTGAADGQQGGPHSGRAMPGRPPSDPHAGHSMPGQPLSDPHAGHAMPATAQPHSHRAQPPAAMPPAGAVPTPQPSASGSCTPEHAAMGHCKPAGEGPPRNSPAKTAADRAGDAHGGHGRPEAATPDAHAGHAMPGAPTHSHGEHSPRAPQANQAPPAPRPDASTGCTPEHAAMGHCTLPSAGADPAPPRGGPPPAALTGPEHAADLIWDRTAMAASRRAVYAEHGGFRGGKILIDSLEYRTQDGHDALEWEGEAWFGGDYDRLWLKAEGEVAIGEGFEEANLQALYSRAIDPWFNLQAGVRHDVRPGPDRTHLALGVQGLAPYWFEVDAALFLSDRGDLTARLEAEYDQRVTNQLILQPRLEGEFALQDVPESGVGAGLSSVELGLRLRYEFVPEFAPYIGLVYESRFGAAADFARMDGDRVGGWAFVTGIRAWF